MDSSPDAQPRVCLTTWFDKRYAAMGKLCRLSLEEYAKRHGYDVAILNGITSDRPNSWNRIPVIRELFTRGYDCVFWIDADAIIVRYDVPIMDEVEEGKDLYMVNWEINGGGFVPNFGVFLIRNSAWSRTMLDALWDMERYVRHIWWENAALLDLMGMAGGLPAQFKKEMPSDAVAKRPDTAFLRRVKWIDEAWNHTVVDTIRVSGKPVIWHYLADPSLPFRAWQMARHARRNGLISAQEAVLLAARAIPARLERLAEKEKKYFFKRAL